MSDTCLLVMMRPYDGAPRPPSATPFGRAAARVAAEGVRVVVGHEVGAGRASGWTIGGEGGGGGDAWRRVDGVAVGAVHDRMAGAAWADLRRRLLAAVPASILVANPESVRAICRDKGATERHLRRHAGAARGEVLPDVELDPRRFEERLRGWGAAYLKPCLGSLGDGVRRVVAGDELPPSSDFLLQRAVDPAPGTSRVALRLLAQREPDGSWLLNPAVARIAASPDDDVVNVHLGARAARAADVCAPAAVDDAARAVLTAFDDEPRAVELGLDFVLDADRRPRLIEVNSVPRGRLGALAALDPPAFEELHVEACARPLRTIAAWAGLAGPSG